MESSKLICTLLTGVAIGVTLGVLYAPEKGEDLRNKLADGSWDFLDFLKDKINDLAEKQNLSSGTAFEPIGKF